MVGFSLNLNKRFKSLVFYSQSHTLITQPFFLFFGQVVFGKLPGYSDLVHILGEAHPPTCFNGQASVEFVTPVPRAVWRPRLWRP